MNKKRLLDLIDTVKKVPAKEFEMGDFCTTTDCGTAGCAAWHYMKRFTKRGMKPADPNPLYLSGYPTDGTNRHASKILADHFRISTDDSWRIFFGDGHGASGKRSVIRTIKAVIKEGEAANA